MKPDGNIFHGLGKRCAACRRREPPLFGGGGTTGWPRATVGCGLSSWAHYASSTSATRPRASSPARCDCVIKQSPNPRGTICRASPSPLPLCCASVFEWVRGTRVYVRTYARVIARTWKSTSRVLSSLFLPSFLPFSLPVFNFFNSATQGGGKLISITKHDRLVCTGFFKWDLRRAFSERKRNWSKDLSRISFPSPESKGKKYPKSSPDRTRFLDSSPRIFFYFDRCLWKEREGGERKGREGKLNRRV